MPFPNLSRWHGGSKWDIELLVNMVSHVGVFVSGYSIGYANQEREPCLPLSRGKSCYGACKHFLVNVPDSTFSQVVLRGYNVTHINWMLAQSLFETTLYFYKWFFGTSSEMAKQLQPDIGSRRLANIPDPNVNADGRTFFHEPCRMLEFKTIDYDPSSSAGIHVAQTYLIGFSRNPDGGFHVRSLRAGELSQVTGRPPEKTRRYGKNASEGCQKCGEQSNRVGQRLIYETARFYGSIFIAAIVGTSVVFWGRILVDRGRKRLGCLAILLGLYVAVGWLPALFFPWLALSDFWWWLL
jgi:hypothetical protein